MVFSDSTYNAWTFKHPKTLYAWDGACVWIPCTYSSLKGSGHILDNLTVYHNFTYNKTAKNYIGTVLYSKNLTTEESTSSQERVRFLGNRRNNCTLLINPVRVDDSGLLGLRVMSRTDKWMASLNLSISGKALRMGPFVSAGRMVGKHPTPGTDHKLGCLQRPDGDARGSPGWLKGPVVPMANWSVSVHPSLSRLPDTQLLYILESGFQVA